MSEPDLAAIEPAELVLDPFSYHPRAASIIQGLGGDERHPDLTYAFHTDYVLVDEGPRQFTVRFDGLSAKVGTLQLRVHMFVEDTNPRILLANTTRIQFNRLLQLGSETSIRFDGFKRVKFALHGAVLGQTDASATGLTITVDGAGAGDDADEVVAEVRNTDFGLSTTQAVTSLISLAPPTFAYPVGQAATPAQTLEPAYAEWSGRLRLDTASARSQWSTAYVLQVLRAYGMLQPGARGLGFGPHADAVAHAVNGAGAEAVMELLPDMHERLPGNLVNFDFLWSIDDIARSGVHEAFGYCEALMKCLRPGGLAVHVLPFVPGLDQRASGGGEPVFRRGDVERLALTMISRGFETSEVRINWADAIVGESPTVGTDVSAFGLVFRKPPLASV